MEVTAVEVDSVSKIYPPGDSPLARLRFMLGWAAGAAGIVALSNIGFSVGRGEAFGIVGANGSGKSTLLKILAGILTPTRGSVRINGRLSALLELGAGFAPDFTGRENVYLNASILGVDRAETAQRFAAIEAFASIGQFIDQPIRTYSTGMVLRLAFAVAAHVDPEILIVDEALAVGDIAFRQRCMRRIHELRAAGVTILFVSHDAMDVKALCDRCLWLERGQVRQIGEADEVVANYLQASLHGEQHTAPAAAGTEAVNGAGRRFGDRAAEVVSTEVVDHTGEPIIAFSAGDQVIVRISVRAFGRLTSPIVGFLVRNAKGESIFGANTAGENYPVPPLESGERFALEFHWIAPQLAAGRYSISVAVAEGDETSFHIRDYIEDAIAVDVPPGHPPVRGYMRLRCESITVVRS